jgi:Flp pilus assembly protein TadG
MSRGVDDRERGSAAIEFVLVGGLVTAMFLAILQVGIVYYVRNVLEACVADGAAYGADADVADSSAGAARADQEIAASLGRRYAHASADPLQTTGDGLRLVTVSARVRLPLLAWFLPEGPQVRVSGHAVLETSE